MTRRIWYVGDRGGHQWPNLNRRQRFCLFVETNFEVENPTVINYMTSRESFLCPLEEWEVSFTSLIDGCGSDQLIFWLISWSDGVSHWQLTLIHVTADMNQAKYADCWLHRWLEDIMLIGRPRFLLIRWLFYPTDRSPSVSMWDIVLCNLGHFPRQTEWWDIK